jgi:hypothetical protein
MTYSLLHIVFNTQYRHRPNGHASETFGKPPENAAGGSQPGGSSAAYTPLQEVFFLLFTE